MRLVIISDIHGNIHALQAVRAGLTAQAPDAVMPERKAYLRSLPFNRGRAMLAGRGCSYAAAAQDQRVSTTGFDLTLKGDPFAPMMMVHGLSPQAVQEQRNAEHRLGSA